MTTSGSSPSPSLAALMQRSGKMLSATVISDFDIAWTAGAGQHRLFQAGSISKPVTALVALNLAAAGEIDLDADINDRLASWQLPDSAATTLRQLLGHTSGVGVPFFPGYGQGTTTPTLLQVLDGRPPATTPAVRIDPAKRGKFCYSGGGFAVVQQLIADITGQKFAHVAHSLVLAPLGMTNSTFDQPLPAGLHPLAARSDWHVYPESAAAGLWTTSADLARVLCAMQAAVAGRPSPVHPGPASLMLTPHTRLPVKGDWNLLPLLGLRPPDSHGLGMFLHGTDRFSHLGGAASFFAAITGSATDGSGAVVMTAANASPFIFRLLRAISAEQGWSGFCQPWWRRLQGLPGIRRLA